VKTFGDVSPHLGSVSLRRIRIEHSSGRSIGINAARKAPRTRNKRISDHFDARRGPGKRGIEELIGNLGFD
jgi:hypothetical protein